jgi:hypothetical protein
VGLEVVDLGSGSVKTCEQQSWRYGGPAMIFGFLVNGSAARPAIYRGVRANGSASLEVPAVGSSLGEPAVKGA